jgi:hypothetical protein
MQIRTRTAGLAAGLGLATAAAFAAAPGAQAATIWTDTSLQATAVASTCTNPAAVTGVAAAKTLTFTAVSGTSFSGAALGTGTSMFDATLTTKTARSIVVTGTTGTGAADVKIKIMQGGCVGAETVLVTETGGNLTGGTPALDVITAITRFNNNTTGAVDFSATPSSTFTEGNLPAGLVSGSPSLRPGSAVPGTYGGVTVTATDAAGAVATGSFGLKVNGHQTTVPGNFGNEVNRYGNGFDVFQQNYSVNAIVVGWTATRADPATHFIRISHGPGVWQFEATRGNGVATGLCVSDPGGGYAGDPGGPNGLVLRGCNTGTFQQFRLLSAQPSQLRNVATGLIIYPNGTGAQLRGSAVPIPGVDSHYTWKDFAQLPA